MIEKQREKEFLFELERLYHNYHLVITSSSDEEPVLMDVDSTDRDQTLREIERYVDILRVETLVVGADENEKALTVWLSPPNDIMSRIGEKVLCNGMIHIVTKAGLIPYRGEASD